MEISEKRCWKGYKPTPNKKPYSKGSCMKESYKLFGKVITEARFREYPRAKGETPRDTLTRYIYVGSEGGKTRLGGLIDPRHGREAIVSRDKRGPEGKASHQVPKNVIGDLYTRARNMKANHTSAMLNKRPPDAPYSQHPTEFYRDTVMTTPGFTPATASGSKPLDQAGKDALRARLVGDYRKRHGLRSHISDKNVTGRMLIGNRLAQKQIERNRQKALERQNYSHMKIESYRLVGKVISENYFRRMADAGRRGIGAMRRGINLKNASRAAMLVGAGLAGRHAKTRYVDQYSNPRLSAPETATERWQSLVDPNWENRANTKAGRAWRDATGERNWDQKAVWGIHDLVTGRNRDKELAAKGIKPGKSGWYGTNESLIVKEAKSAAWQRKEGKNPEGGLNKKGIASYRAANPGSKLSMAVTTKPSKLKKGSKSAKRRKSFCARMSGMKKRLTSSKTAKDPNSRINKSLRKWNC
jgi:hypothetical protein